MIIVYRSSTSLILRGKSRSFLVFGFFGTEKDGVLIHLTALANRLGEFSLNVPATSQISPSP